MTSLLLHFNELKEIPNISSLPLQVLSLSFNEGLGNQRTLPFCFPVSLKSLYLQSISLNDVPPTIPSLIQLRTLALGISSTFCNIPHLLILTFFAKGGNNISEIPEDLDQLKSLKMLDLEFNRLNRLPHSVLKMFNRNSNLIILLSDNPLLSQQGQWELLERSNLSKRTSFGILPSPHLEKTRKPLEVSKVHSTTGGYELTWELESSNPNSPVILRRKADNGEQEFTSSAYLFSSSPMRTRMFGNRPNSSQFNPFASLPEQFDLSDSNELPNSGKEVNEVAELSSDVSSQNNELEKSESVDKPLYIRKRRSSSNSDFTLPFFSNNPLDTLEESEELEIVGEKSVKPREKRHGGLSPRILKNVPCIGLSLPREEFVKLKVGMASQNGKRKEMEDFSSTCFDESNLCVTVCDGEGGVSVSEMVYSRLPPSLLSKVRNVKDVKDFDGVSKIIIDTFAETNQDIKKNLGIISSNCGSSSAVLLCLQNVFYFANLGNVRILSSVTGKISQLHTTDNPQERDRVLSEGGQIYENNLDGYLHNSRSFGFFDFPAVSCVPYISQFSVEAKMSKECDPIFFLILSAGFSNFVSDEMAIQITTKSLLTDKNPQKAAFVLKSAALLNGSTEDITTAVIITSYPS